MRCAGVRCDASHTHTHTFKVQGDTVDVKVDFPNSIPSTKYIQGRVAHVNMDGTYGIMFAGGVKDGVCAYQIKGTAAGLAWEAAHIPVAQEFKQGDRIEAHAPNSTNWLRGRVGPVKARFAKVGSEATDDETYTIIYDNGVVEKDVPVDYVVAAPRRVHSRRRSEIHSCCSTASCSQTGMVVLGVLILCLWIAFLVGASNPKASWSGYDCLVKKWNAEKQYTEVWNAEVSEWQEYKQGRRLFGSGGVGGPQKTDNPDTHKCKMGGMTLAMLISALVLCCMPLAMLCCTGQLKPHSGGDFGM